MSVEPSVIDRIGVETARHVLELIAEKTGGDVNHTVVVENVINDALDQYEVSKPRVQELVKLFKGLGLIDHDLTVRTITPTPDLIAWYSDEAERAARFRALLVGANLVVADDGDQAVPDASTLADSDRQNEPPTPPSDEVTFTAPPTDEPPPPETTPSEPIIPPTGVRGSYGRSPKAAKTTPAETVGDQQAASVPPTATPASRPQFGTSPTTAPPPAPPTSPADKTRTGWGQSTPRPAASEQPPSRAGIAGRLASPSETNRLSDFGNGARPPRPGEHAANQGASAAPNDTAAPSWRRDGSGRGPKAGFTRASDANKGVDVDAVLQQLERQRPGLQLDLPTFYALVDELNQRAAQMRHSDLVDQDDVQIDLLKLLDKVRRQTGGDTR